MTKKLLKGLAVAGLALLASVGFIRPAAAINNAEAALADLTRIGDARYVSTNVAATLATGPGNEESAIQLYYVGAATESLVTISQTAMTFYAPFNVADTSIGSSGVITISAAPNNTIGGLCDTINNSTKYRCRMNDARRTDNTTLLGDQTEVSGTGNLGASGGFSIIFDTGGLAAIGQNVGFLSMGITPASGRRVILKSCKYSANSSGTTGPTFSVSGVRMKLEGASDGVTRNDGTVVWSQTGSNSVSSNTAVNVAFADVLALGGTTDDGGLAFAANVNGQTPGGGYVFGGVPGPSTGLFGNTQDGHVVIRVASDDSNAKPQTGGTNFLTCSWMER